MPKVVGAWLAGLYDNDRATSRAARDALKLVFTTEEKVGNVWRHYHGAILEYCTNVITNESKESLSDERQVSPDDAESKFARVIATCVLTVGHLLCLYPSPKYVLVEAEIVVQLTTHAASLPSGELAKQDAVYHDLSANPHLWTFTYHPDPFLRKSLYKFLQLTLQKRPDLISNNLDTISTALLIKSFSTPQVGSVTDLLDALLDLTQALPAAWTTLKPPKKRTPIALIQRFIKQGSQTAGPEYWGKVAKLVSALPAEIHPTTKEGVKELLNAIVDGIRSGPEPRGHLVAAWGAYFATCYHLLEVAEEGGEVAGYVLADAMYPVYEEYIYAADESSRLKISYYGAAICAGGIAMAGVQSEGVVKQVREEVWRRVKDLVVGSIKSNSAVDGKAAVNVKEVGKRWADLCAEILKRTRPENPVVEIVRMSNVDVLVASIETVVAEKGMRSDVATLLEVVLSRFGDSVLAIEQAQQVRFF